MNDIIEYIINLLIQIPNNHIVAYSSKEEKDYKLTIIKSSFFDESVYGTQKSLPDTPFSEFYGFPILFGSPKEEKVNDHIVLYADYIASSYFLLSRYEEFIKKNERDQFGRYLAKNSIIYQQHYGLCPLVDEWGRIVRKLLRELGVNVPDETKGFSNIYLTHDIDLPFYYKSLKSSCRQTLGNILHRRKNCLRPIKGYFNTNYDSYYTFPRIFKYDNLLKNSFSKGKVVALYFIISTRIQTNKEYYDIYSKKYRKLIKKIKENGGELGLHVSFEADNQLIHLQNEINALSKIIDTSNLKSRNHYLRWTEPEYVDFMEAAGIEEDYTLGYADYVGFRCGTCKPFRFINPKTKRLTNVIIHPLEMMECSFVDEDYMNLSIPESYEISKKIIDTVYDLNGELDILFHNNNFGEGKELDEFYSQIINYIKQKSIYSNEKKE